MDPRRVPVAGEALQLDPVLRHAPHEAEGAGAGRLAREVLVHAPRRPRRDDHPRAVGQGGEQRREGLLQPQHLERPGRDDLAQRAHLAAAGRGGRVEVAPQPRDHRLRVHRRAVVEAHARAEREHEGAALLLPPPGRRELRHEPPLASRSRSLSHIAAKTCRAARLRESVGSSTSGSLAMPIRSAAARPPARASVASGAARAASGGPSGRGAASAWPAGGKACPAPPGRPRPCPALRRRARPCPAAHRAATRRCARRAAPGHPRRPLGPPQRRPAARGLPAVLRARRGLPALGRGRAGVDRLHVLLGPHRPRPPPPGGGGGGARAGGAGRLPERPRPGAGGARRAAGRDDPRTPTGACWPRTAPTRRPAASPSPARRPGGARSWSRAAPTTGPCPGARPPSPA